MLTKEPKKGTIEPIMGTLGSNNLSAALFGKVRHALLTLFYSHPDESYYLRQIVRNIGMGQGAVQRELAGLNRAGIITRENRGNQVHYQANRDCPIYPELHGLILKTSGLVDVLYEYLVPLSNRIDTAFVYGSQADGTAGPDSDIDLLLVGEADELAIHRAVDQAEKKLNRPINYSLFNKKEFKKRQQESEGFLARILKGNKLFILGNTDVR